ncbi:serine/threonine-protein kinase pim-3-like [Brachyistius frenatus]|uniref:serine/threonine-protein kinase pim-3-like n=1 Tax=Brachyistius frenatus TaxID=100188 RepID=UPI0037E8FA82
MERPVPSVDLREYVDSNGPQEEDMVKSIMKQLVEASIHMQSAGVFHRDLKLDNVLIHPGVSGPRVRIIDFGCGCATQKEPHRFYYSGTTAYAPPEVFSCGAYHDGPTTVWHLGAIMYEMLDGQEDFSTVSFLRSPIKINNKLSRRCRALLKACWVTDPEKRVTLQQMRQHAWLK